ncbi:MAG: hypothetical protein HRT94_05825 [Alphaproteobacteria bacterium]|nr:hypothetical protein [Alphaproteobacteria bacterium]
MSLNTYNPDSRYKDRAAQRFVAFLKFLSVVMVSILIGFWFGKQFAAEELIVLKDRNAALEEERELLQESVTELGAQAQTAETRYRQLQEQVDSIIPKGPMQDIATLVRDQLEQGMDPERLSFVIRSARPPTNCSEPDVKRFVVSTPANKGPSSKVSIAEGAIVIQGSGKSAKNEKGQPEAWYDPAQPVKLTFAHDGKTDVKRRTLPIRYSVVAGDREYRFTVESGSRSFAKVVYDSCDYP